MRRAFSGHTGQGGIEDGADQGWIGKAIERRRATHAGAVGEIAVGVDVDDVGLAGAVET